MTTIATMPAITLERALQSMEDYWTNVLHLPGVPNTAARALSNYTVVDTYLKMKSIQESRLK